MGQLQASIIVALSDQTGASFEAGHEAGAGAGNNALPDSKLIIMIAIFDICFPLCKINSNGKDGCIGLMSLFIRRVSRWVS